MPPLCPAINVPNAPWQSHSETRVRKFPEIDALDRWRPFVDACKPQSANCAAAFAAGGAVFEQWIGSENWLLERYRELTAHLAWQNATPFDVAAPLPPHALVVDGQRLLLLNARKLAESGDSVAVRKLLGDDLRFWRMVLESSDILISRMIATAAINRHFELGSLIFGQMRPADVMNAIPANWRIAVSESELSMHRCLVGEWMLLSAALRNTDVDFAVLHEDSVVARAMRGLTAPLFQQQDTMNRNAEYIWRMNEILSVPIERYEDSMNRTAEFSRQTRREALQSVQGHCWHLSPMKHHWLRNLQRNPSGNFPGPKTKCSTRRGVSTTALDDA